MTEHFAKLYESDQHGQILVVIDRNDDGDPAIIVSARPPDLGVCSTTFAFSDTDEGWDKCEEAFSKADFEWAVDMATMIFQNASKFTTN